MSGYASQKIGYYPVLALHNFLRALRSYDGWAWCVLAILVFTTIFYFLGATPWLWIPLLVIGIIFVLEFVRGGPRRRQ